MQMPSSTVQRLEVVVEQNKSDTWSVASYLVTTDGQRFRRGLATFPIYQEAAASLKNVWQEMGSEKVA